MDHRIEELLVDWELARQNGEDVAPEVLCSSCPELIEPLRLQIESLSSMSWVFDENAIPPNAASSDSVEPAIPQINLSALVQSLTDSQLVTKPLLEIVASELESVQSADGKFDPKLAISVLVNKARLTHYQARQCLIGKQSGLQLDRYVILDVIDEGGMGIVYKAKHLSMDRLVALKMLPDHLLRSEESAARFKQEIKTLASLSHPNIVTAYDAHTVDDRYFLAMEYCEGQDLNAVVRDNGAMDSESACRVIDQICLALQKAHDENIVHRDVKPSNIILTNDGQARLLDLGLARLVALSDSERHNAGFDENAPVGTIAYMSPEQTEPGKQVDHLADIYSLGCTFYFLLKGQPPFSGNNPVQTMLDHRETATPDLGDEVPENVRQCVKKMTAKNPASRFQSMNQVRQHLLGAETVFVETTAKPSVDSPNSSLLRWLVPVVLSIFAGIVTWLLISQSDKSPDSAKAAQTDLLRWVLNQGGYANIESVDWGQQTLDEINSIPEYNFQITSIEMPDIDAPRSLIPFSNLPQLRELFFSGPGTQQYRWDELADCKSLTSVSFSELTLDDDAVDSLTRLPSLRQIAIVDCELTDSQCETIFQLSSLKSLTLQMANLSSDTLIKVVRNTQLETLDLTGTEGVSHELVMAIEPKSNLKRLLIGGDLITDESLRHLGQFDKLEFLALDFCGNVSETGLEHLFHLSRLQGLSLVAAPLNDEGIRKIASSFLGLETLDVSATNVSSSSLSYLASVSQLIELGLAELPIRDRHLEQFLDFPSLRALDLGGTRVTAKGLDTLALLGLDTLSVIDCNIPEEDLQDFCDSTTTTVITN